jgi:hypothetical protein
MAGVPSGGLAVREDFRRICCRTGARRAVPALAFLLQPGLSKLADAIAPQGARPARLRSLNL